MFEVPSVISLQRHGGITRHCSRAKLDGADQCQSVPDELFDPLVSAAATLFVGSQIRPGALSQLAIADWLARSPCHECAWRRVWAAWRVLPMLRELPEEV